ncbi:hypothetical protein [Corynebacterium bovis]|uniref:Uncharacterized protein n=1 Tax=Corynebacterium bovis TaxID=36808 RepID=A0A426Q0V5_9CORY|nr:hypothetical protein [Corynebacterium bovis]MDN8578509.1 hypothetical protein [Corynebacterium bovis]RRO87602.1 hypothetical protein CXF48_01390 [Corynebacterium bovis]RRO88939.1 hypothetical protein CXF30_04420 [Corynebacterium bovis]
MHQDPSRAALSPDAARLLDIHHRASPPTWRTAAPAVVLVFGMALAFTPPLRGIELVVLAVTAVVVLVVAWWGNRAPGTRPNRYDPLRPDTVAADGTRPRATVVTVAAFLPYPAFALATALPGWLGLPEWWGWAVGVVVTIVIAAVLLRPGTQNPDYRRPAELYRLHPGYRPADDAEQLAAVLHALHACPAGVQVTRDRLRDAAGFGDDDHLDAALAALTASGDAAVLVERRSDGTRETWHTLSPEGRDRFQARVAGTDAAGAATGRAGAAA